MRKIVSGMRRAYAVAAVLVCVVTNVPAAVADAGMDVHCRQVDFAVDAGMRSGTIAGTFCSPPQATLLQILLPGITYNRTYWDFPYEDGDYSYTKYANSAGYATLAVDRLGTGDSSHPLSVTIDYNAHVDTINQVVRAVRGAALGASFAKIVLVGHSYGSMVAYGVAGRFRDVDGLIVTGASHTPNYLKLGLTVGMTSYPAMFDPKFRGLLSDPGYLTTRPGLREVFYYLPDASPEVIETDERLKDLTNPTELTTVVTLDHVSDTSDQINVPVLTVLGDHDPFNCGQGAADCSSSESLARSEREHLAAAPVVEAVVIPHTGHDLNLEFTRLRTWRSMTDFLQRNVSDR